MDYIKIYNSLIDKRKNIPATNNIERHHILPRCMGGSDDPTNIVCLTRKEHYVAHLLLSKIYPDVPGLKYALFLFSANSGSMYSKNREKAIILLKNRKVNEHTRKMMSKSQKKRFADDKQKSYLVGRKFSDHSRHLISNSRKKWCTEDNINIMLKNLERSRLKDGPSMLGKHHSDVSKNKMKETWRSKGTTVLKYDILDNEYTKYLYPTDAGKHNNVHPSNITACANKNLRDIQKPPNSAGGFYWLYDTIESKLIFTNRLGKICPT